MAGAAGSFLGLSRLVHRGFPIQGCCFGLLKQLIVTDLAVILGTFEVLGMIKGHIPVLRREGQRGRSFFLLTQRGQSADDEAGNPQCSE